MKTTPVLAQLIKVKRLRAAKLPRAEMAQLETIAAAKPARGKAPRRSALLFTGERAAIAAEALAKQMGLDLFGIDLARVVSKYIGETEKNLERVFAAAGDGAILLFDEADALFGKRSDVKDAHDRYANLDVARLLQLMEGYAGLVVLASATLRPLSPAVKRRLRVFAFPPKG
jgi:SpoVK/Ycf46/Vps4 family AAA+-type ATPase